MRVYLGEIPRQERKGMKKALAFGAQIVTPFVIFMAAYAFYTGDRAILKLSALLCMLYAGSEFSSKIRALLHDSQFPLAGVAKWANELFYWVVVVGTIALLIAFLSGSFA
jgi:hypothetical protein